jgi:hypothetical protein
LGFVEAPDQKAAEARTRSDVPIYSDVPI